MKTRRDKLDDIFSKLVRERANWTCEAQLPKCMGYFPEGPGRRMLHCSHFFSRRKQSTRFDPENAAAHCFSCHKKLEENPLDFAEWVKAHLGNGTAEKLRIRSATIVKRNKADKEDLYQDMKAAWDDLQARRRAGETGRLEFEL
ncbi:MAG: hypothetical protein ACR2RF_24925 [Geminicoccaceae bacterium]